MNAPVPAEDVDFVPSLLCPTRVDRERLREMNERLEAGGLIHLLLPSAMAVTALTVSPWALLPILGGPLFATLDRHARTLRKPEWLLFAALAVTALGLSGGIGMTGGVRSPLTVWLAFVAVGVSLRLGRRGILAVMGVLAVGSGVALLLARPFPPVGRLPLLVNLVAAVIAAGHYPRVLANVELYHRQQARVDPLTGLLNRASLASRFEELRQQAAHTGEPVSLVLCDLDGFKAVNDRYGHARGDDVLRDLAAQLRRSTRSSELVYRLGGEEFLIMLRAADAAAGSAVAERLRRSVAQCRPGGLPLTASFGVATGCGDQIDFQRLYRAADAALYAAKAAGRDAVRVSPALPGGHRSGPVPAGR